MIGIEERDNEDIILLLDPSLRSEQIHTVLIDTRNCVRLLKKSKHQLTQKEYEIIFIDGLLEQEADDVSHYVNTTR